MSLNVTVTPGHTFTDSETVTTAKMNAAATPTVAVTGSIDASEIAVNAVDTPQIKNEAVDAAKMGVTSLVASTSSTMTPSNHNKKGVILVSGAVNNSPEGQFQQLWAGEPNSFLIGHATRTDEVWTGDWSARSKVLNSNSSIKVDQQDSDSFTFLIKENAVTKAMMADNAIGNTQLGGQVITLDKITPGGGSATNNSGGIAKTNNDFWAGIIQFDPAQEAGDTGFNGKAVATQATGKNQVLYANAKSTPLNFGHHPCIPKAFAMIRANGEHAGAASLNASNFTIIHSEGISEIQKVYTSGDATTYATYKVKLTSGYETMFGGSANGVGDTPNGVITGTPATDNASQDASGIFGVVTGAIDGNREFEIKTYWYSDASSLGNNVKAFNSILIQLY